MFDLKNTCPRCGNEKTSNHTICPNCLKQLRRCVREHNGRARKNGYFGRVNTRSWVDRLEKNNFSCSFCGKHHSKHSPIELDHIFPLHQGGFNISGNTQPLCKVCHRLKDINLPKSYSIFTDEKTVYVFLSIQFIKWLANRKTLSDSLPLALWFYEEYQNKFREFNLYSLKKVILRCFSYKIILAQTPTIPHQPFDIPNIGK